MVVGLSRDEIADLFEARQDVFIKRFWELNAKSDLSMRFSFTEDEAEWRDGKFYIDNNEVAVEELAKVVERAASNAIVAFLDAITERSEATQDSADQLSDRQLLVQIDNRTKRLTDAILDNTPPSGTSLSDLDEPDA